MDFINDSEMIQTFFTQYYGGELYLPTENETDPNILYAKRDHILISSFASHRDYNLTVWCPDRGVRAHNQEPVGSNSHRNYKCRVCCDFGIIFHFSGEIVTP